MNCTPLNTGDQYWIELLFRRDHDVLLPVTSVAHEDRTGAATAIEPLELLKVVWQSAFGKAPVVSPFPMMMPEDANPPEVTRLAVP